MFICQAPLAPRTGGGDHETAGDTTPQPGAHVITTKRHRLIYNDDGGGIAIGATGDPVERLRETDQLRSGTAAADRASLLRMELGLEPWCWSATALTGRTSCSRRVKQRGLDWVVRLHQCRKADFRRGQRLGPGDHIVEWSRPPRPEWMRRTRWCLLGPRSRPNSARIVTCSGVRVFLKPPALRVVRDSRWHRTPRRKWSSHRGDSSPR